MWVLLLFGGFYLVGECVMTGIDGIAVYVQETGDYGCIFTDVCG